MEFPRRPDEASPLHGPEEAEQAEIAAAAGPHDSRTRHLRRVPLFSGFSEDQLRRVAEISKIIEAPAGTVLTQVGDPGDSFFIVIDGRAAAQTPIGIGESLQPGDFFGEMSLVDGEPRSTTVTATTDVRLLVVERSHFWRLLDETPDLIRRILMVLSRRVRTVEQAVGRGRSTGWRRLWPWTRR